jgi:phosphonopyruvate decarboxylase
MNPQERLSNAASRTREIIKTTKELTATPTDVELVDKMIKDGGVKDFVWVPCSITDTMQDIIAKKAERGEVNYYQMVNEHSLAGVAAGIYLATGRVAMIHMQNSGLPNAGDGLVSFSHVYETPMAALVTWRGNNKKDDSEPHQEIGKITSDLTRTIFKDTVHGDRWGRGVLAAMNNVFEDTQNGRASVLRLSPEAFKKVHPLVLTEGEFDVRAYEERYRKVRETKGNSSNAINSDERLSRDEAIRRIIENHEDAAILFSNGYTSRAAQEKNDRLGNFYNVGFMGGTMAIGWGMAKSNPDMEIVVVDGDQNSEMGKMHEILAQDYPENLHWYILNNEIGASVGTARSIPLPPWYSDLARIINTVPDEPSGERKFKSPRVGARGKYFDTDEMRVMAELVGPLPAHAKRFKNWVLQKTTEKRQTREFRDRLERPSFHSPL